MPYVIKDWLAEHVKVPADMTAEELARALVKVGLEEEAIHSSDVTGPVVFGRVLKVEPEPQKNGKTINWCQVDVGAHNVTDETGEPVAPRGIVCGAHNFEQGDLVVVSLPGAVLPGGFAIASRKTYGHVSDGMICSARELGLGDEHDGIIVYRKANEQSEADPAPGTDALGPLGLSDEILEINVTPDRGYCFSVRGVAREFALSTGAEFTDPGLPAAPLPGPTADGFEVEVEDGAPVHGAVGCDRFVTRIVRGIDPQAPSPQWMQERLTKAGMRPISLSVDVTNYVMLDLGQPLHAYDLSKVSAPIVVRRGREGEGLTTLDGVERRLSTEDLLITDSPAGQRGSRVLGIAGVMGGASSEVSETTTDVLIEAAHFDPVSIARSSRRHKLPSEAAKRFERGVDPKLAPVAAQRVVELLVEFGGGVADAAVSDLDDTTAPAPIQMRLSEPQRLVGVAYTRDQVVGVLEAIGARVESAGEDDVTELLRVTPPTWRPDLTGPAELVEEVARIVGYDEIVPVLPKARAGRGLTDSQRLRRSVARSLAEQGLVETLSYPFVAPDVNDILDVPAGDQRRGVISLVNPLGDDRPDLRTSLLATLLDTAKRNLGRGASDLELFEIGQVFLRGDHSLAAPSLPGGTRPSDSDLDELATAVPDQPRHVAGILLGNRERSGWWGEGRAADWADAIDLGRTVVDVVGIPVSVSSAEYAPFHPGRCASFTVEQCNGEDTIVAGYAGELHPKVLERLGLPPRSVAFELDLDALIEQVTGTPVESEPVSAYPVSKEDLAFVVDEGVPAEAVAAALRVGGGDLVESVRLFDVYRGDQLGEGKKSLAFALRLRADDRTLTAQDAAAVRESAITAAAVIGATLRV
ncbi:phenylalanine--tRNA ligase subunit beta [Rarobacter faecitabidus]|uniref:Phenylalanine--tRNA ligase beta subunit n=1 Tax=Rarobacter faecitabidus TaxID=13243 RepID=A0A542ZWB3_RARFA|nr:phenylalanine--tRNA ligase subunit beta [Rarobacter faecitabidus]TQL64589.1 phenylalanyl-tRNA synthetase beta subunit [Rarobacter faecitabidus]